MVNINEVLIQLSILIVIGKISYLPSIIIYEYFIQKLLVFFIQSNTTFEKHPLVVALFLFEIPANSIKQCIRALFVSALTSDGFLALCSVRSKGGRVKTQSGGKNQRTNFNNIQGFS